VTDFSTDKMSYGPGGTANTIATIATIGNVGDVSAMLTATLTIKDELGQTMGSQTSGEFTVPTGGSYGLPLAWTGTLNDGSYQATVTIWRSGDTVGGSSAGFQVMSYSIYLPVILNSFQE
jgi:hypothetical protein